MILPSLPTTLDRRSNSLGHLLVERDDFVEQAGDLAVDAVDLFGEAHGEVAAAEARKRADELAAIQAITEEKVVQRIAPSCGPPLEIRMQIPFFGAL